MALDTPCRKYMHHPRALDRVATPGSKPGRYHAPDSLLAFLETI